MTAWEPHQLRPPFEPGNTLSTKHGAKSERVIRPIADRLVAGITEERPDLAEAQYEPAITAWATAEAQCILLRRYADDYGLLDQKGLPRPFTRLWRLAGASAAQHRKRLGLDPSSNAQLVRDRATASALRQFDLDAVLESGRRAFAERDQDQHQAGS